MIALGYKNYISKDDVSSIIGKINSRPIQVLMDECKRKGTFIDVTFGRKAKCLVISKSGWLYLVALDAKTIQKRFMAKGVVNDETEQV